MPPSPNQPPTPAPTTPTAAEPWTTRRLLAWMQQAFKDKHLDSPRLCAEILLGHILNQDRLKLYTDQDREASPAELQSLRGLVGRALKHEPVQYLVGQAWFFGLALKVDSRVLIPRPCTEMIVEEIIQLARRRQRIPHADESPARTPTFATEPISQPLPTTAFPSTESESLDETDVGTDVDVDVAAERAAIATQRRQLAQTRARRSELGTGMLIADVCTGSGCIAIAIAKHLPGAKIIATDISQDALDLASENARAHHVHERIDFRQGDLLNPVVEALQELDGAYLDALVTNPPYIPDHEWDAVAENVRNFEPTLALRAGPLGTHFVEPLLRDAPAILKPHAIMLMEIAACTADGVLAAAQEHPELSDALMKKDLEGLSRMLMAKRKG